MVKFTHGMIDVETLDTEPTSVITQLCFIPFDMQGNTGEPYEARLCIQEEIDMGFTINAETLLFWMNQPKEAQEAVFGKEDMPYESNAEIFDELGDYIKSSCTKNFSLWQHSTFDAPLLEYHYTLFGFEEPWHYRCPKDIRTLNALAGDVIKPAFVGIPHNSKDDCLNQIEYVRTMWNLVK